MKIKAIHVRVHVKIISIYLLSFSGSVINLVIIVIIIIIIVGISQLHSRLRAVAPERS